MTSHVRLTPQPVEITLGISLAYWTRCSPVKLCSVRGVPKGAAGPRCSHAFINVLVDRARTQPRNLFDAAEQMIWSASTLPKVSSPSLFLVRGCGAPAGAAALQSRVVTSNRGSLGSAMPSTVFLV